MRKWILILIAGMSLTTFSCAKKSEKRKIGHVRATRGATEVNNQIAQGVGINQSSNLGLIGDPTNPARFNERIKELVSANFDPSQMGNVSADGSIDSTKEQLKGVWFKGSLAVPKEFCQANSQMNETTVDASQSSLQISIFDDLIGKKMENSEGEMETVSAPIEISFSTAKTGQLTRTNGTVFFRVTFADAYGEVMLWGQINGHNAEGYVYFTNSKTFDGSKPNSTQAKLGALVIPHTAFLSCK